MTKLETIARIIDPAWWRFLDQIGPRYQCLDPVQAEREKQLAKAREVVEVLRDCDSESARQLVAGKKALFCYAEDPTIEDARNCWHAMCDAILSEAEEDGS